MEKYALALEQEQITSEQVNPVLARMSPDRRESFKNRRKFWSQNQKPTSGDSTKASQSYFFKITGDLIERSDGNDYRAREALFSPCRCADDEAPAWGFRSYKIEAQLGGYADLYHPILEVKGVPVLYLPYLKMPIKDQRQSGFLPPTFTNDAGGSGNIYSQPVYFDLGRDLDATLSTDVFERRGTKLGVELRYAQREFSGWELNVEGIRDRKWVEDRDIREALLTDYFDDSPYCTNVIAKELAECRKRVRTRLGVPANTWRSSKSWRGSTILRPRVSFASRGEVLSDHRYVKDLKLSDAFQDALNNTTQANMFSTTSARLNYDGKSQYIGAYSGFGDNVLLPRSYQGYQKPLNGVFQTRMYKVVPGGRFTSPVYAQLMTEHRTLVENSMHRSNEYSTPQSLGDGQWQRAKVDFVSPLVTDSVIQVDHFTDFEARRINHAALDPSDSNIRSWRTGLTFNLPIDGMTEIPGWKSESTDSPESRAKRYFHHIMNWSVTFSARPSVVRRGPYGDVKDANGADLLFAGTDRKYYVSGNDDIGDPSDWMHPHQIVSFSTSHSWRAFSRNWIPKEGAKKVDPNTSGDYEDATKDLVTSDEKVVKETFRERARRELVESVDRSLNSLQDIVDPKNPNQIITKQYKRNDFDVVEPLRISSSISYDRVKEDLRRKAVASGQTDGLPEPWSEASLVANMAAYQFVLNADARYNIYKRYVGATNLSLQLPGFFSSSASLGYTILREAFENNGSLSFKLTNTRSVTFSTSLIPRISALVRLEEKSGDIPEAREKLYYRTVVALAYSSPSECWGLNFARSKDYGVDERAAVYTLQLGVVFGGASRSFSGLEKSILKEVREKQNTSS